MNLCIWTSRCQTLQILNWSSFKAVTGFKCQMRGWSERRSGDAGALPLRFSSSFFHTSLKQRSTPDRSVPASPLGLQPHELESSLNSVLSPNYVPQLMWKRAVCLPYFSTKSGAGGNADEVRQNSQLLLTSTMRSLFSANLTAGADTSEEVSCKAFNFPNISFQSNSC